jgi:hypothetical protein
MPRSVPLLLYVAIASLGDALAPTRRAALRSAVGALGLTTAQRAVAATNAEAEKVRVASRELSELLKNEDALRFKVLVEGSGTDSASVASLPPARHRRDATHDAAHAGKLPIAVSFITFQKLEKDCGDDFMGAAIEYAETYKDAKDLVKLAVLSKGDGGGPDVATRYYERALPNLKDAAAKLDDVVKLLPK